jgi:hypothetical protein
MVTFSIEDAYEMEEWGTCDIYDACMVTAFGIGIWCYEY